MPRDHAWARWGLARGVSFDDGEDVNWGRIHTLLLSLGSRLGGGLAGGGLFLGHFERKAAEG